MAKTYADLLTGAREILQDTNTDSTLQRYKDQVLLDILNRGLQELYRIRPDAFYDLWDDTAEDFLVPEVTDLTNAFALPMMFFDPLVNWTIGMTEAIDDEFADDARSTQFRTAFKAAVLGL